MPLTYHSYLKLPQLLSLQELRSPEEHDEMLFIIIHQTYELWFREMLHELDFICRKLEEGDILRARHNLRRNLTILKILVHQIDILETMTPLEFLAFRGYLEAASGFQSYQWRELEFSLGLKSDIHLKRYVDEPEITKILKKRLNTPSLWIIFLKYLEKEGYEIPKDLVEGDVTRSNQRSEKIQEVLVEVYHSNPAVSQFCELLVDLDEGIQEWRYRHVKMVERTIGTKPGTGGSPGVEYLKASLFNPLFPDLWEIRSEFKP